MLALGNVGRSGGGCNIYRGHDNVQGATDVGPNPDTLPGYYPVAVPGSWTHWAGVWNIDLDWLKKRYASEAMMAKPGMTVSRWIDGVLEKNDAIDQDSNLRAIFYWGHAPNSQTRGTEMLEAMKKLDLMVVIDPYPSASAAMFAKVRKDGAYLLPAATQFETEGSVTASNRSLQWREKVIDPLFESRTDQMIMYQFAQKLGFADQFLGKKDGKQNIQLVKGKGGMDEPSMEDTLRNEINKGSWTIGYTGQSPERLQAHMRNQHLFDVKTLRAKGGKDAKTGYDLTGDYYGLPWPCYGSAAIKHPGSPNLYDNSKHVMDGGGCFRALFGVEKDGVNLLAEDGSYPKGSEITTGYPQFDHVLLKKLGWWDELTDEEKKVAEGKTWANDTSGGIQRVAMKHGCHPYGNAKARAVVWNFPGPGREISDARRRQDLLAPADALQVGAAEGGEGGDAQEVSADPDERTPGRVRGWRRGDALQPVARRAAAGQLRRAEPEDRGRPQRPQRRVRLGVDADGREDQGEGEGHRGHRPRHRVHPVPLLGLVAGRGHAALLPGGRGADCARRGGQHRDHLRLRPGDDDAGIQDHAVRSGEGIGGNHGENEIPV